MLIYEYIEERNSADTCRDEDCFSYSNRQYFKTFIRAKNYARRKYSYYFKNLEDDFEWDDEKQCWKYCCIGSYAPVLYIKEIENDNNSK